MVFIARRKVVVAGVFLIIALFALFLPKEEKAPVFSGKLSRIIIIDAGHGFPDGGAVGMNGTIESTLNLKIALMAQKSLTKKGYKVIMTRNGDNSLSDEGKTIAERKRSDMYKRLDIIKSSGADIFVSIHMNKYTDSRYRGAQVLYSGNFLQSQLLAQNIQSTLCTLKDNTSKRATLQAPESIFLLKNSPVPAVIVECGFLSNFEEERLLNTESYQKAVAASIVKGIENYYSLQKNGKD